MSISTFINKTGALAAAVAMLAFVVAPGLSNAAAGQIMEFSASISPTSVSPSSSNSFTVTVTNLASSTKDIKSIRIAIPSGFSVTNVSGITGWGVSTTSSYIQASDSGPPDGIPPGSSVGVTFTASAPASEGSANWTTQAFANNSFSPGEGAEFSPVGSQTTVDVETPNLPQCSDGQDNDGDGRTDTADPSCHTDQDANNSGSYDGDIDNESNDPQCNDGSDNDDDGFIDAADPACHTDQDAGNPESYDSTLDDESNDPPPAACSDGIDNDQDGAIDSGESGDVGCENASDNDESNPIINATAGANGSISPSGDVGVVTGDNASFTLSPADGYQVDEVTIDLVVDTLFSGTIYTFNNVTVDHSISVTFSLTPPGSHTIVATAGANGTITPSGNVTAGDGDDQNFIFTPDSGYEVDQILVDGSSGVATSTDSYTFENVTEDHTIDVSFVLSPTEDTLLLCSDGEDNDGDRAVDLADSDCAPFKPVLTIVKNAFGSDGIFTFSITGAGDTNVTATTTTSSNVGTTTVTLNFAGSYNVIENANLGWDFDSVSCAYGDQGFGSILDDLNGETIDVDAGDTVTCTFRNTVHVNEPTTGTLVVQKVVINDNDGTGSPSDFSFQINGEEAVSIEEDGDNQYTLAPGVYSVTEVAAEGYDVSYDNCSEVTVVAGETATCTITNNDQKPANPPGGDTGGRSGGHSNGGGSVLGNFIDTGEVLGNVCPLITDYMKEGMANSPAQVSLLQTFLNGEVMANLPTTGFFGPLTTAAVNTFQSKYQPEVLAPWGPFGYSPTKPTGYVFKTTKWKINTIACPDLNIPFPELP